MTKIPKLLSTALLCLLFSTQAGASTNYWHHQKTGVILAQEKLQSLPAANVHSPVAIGLFDVSFYGHEQLLTNALHPEASIITSSLYSPHGGAVASIITGVDVGTTKNAEIHVLNTGIFLDDFKHGIDLVRKHEVKLVNISLGLREAAIAEALTQANEELGTIFVVTSGNSGERLRKDLPEYYHDLKAIIVSCVDQDGTIPGFAQIDSTVTVLAPCGKDNIPSLMVTWNSLDPNAPKLIKPYMMGMTSSGAPQVTAAITDALTVKPDLDLEEIKKLLRETATEFVEYEGHQYPVLNHLGLVEALIENSR